MQIAQHASWWWPFENAVILTRRPVSISRDSRNRLHNVHGPALAYADGFTVWAFHGVRVDQELIEHPERITVERIRNERNAEVRRVLIDRYGSAKYIRDSGAKVIHQDDFGKLYKAEQIGDEPIVVVELLNSTPEPIGYKPDKGEHGSYIARRWHKHYMLRVPPTVKTAHEAAAWLGKTTVDKYAPLIET
jgi:hypothetical protein